MSEKDGRGRTNTSKRIARVQHHLLGERVFPAIVLVFVLGGLVLGSFVLGSFVLGSFVLGSFVLGGLVLGGLVGTDRTPGLQI